jgi:hypothetical protein
VRSARYQKRIEEEEPTPAGPVCEKPILTAENNNIENSHFLQFIDFFNLARILLFSKSSYAIIAKSNIGRTIFH